MLPERISNVTRIQSQRFLEEAGISAETSLTGAGIVSDKGPVEAGIRKKM